MGAHYTWNALYTAKYGNSVMTASELGNPQCNQLFLFKDEVELSDGPTADLWCSAAQKPAHLWSSRTAPVPGKRRAQKQSKSLRRRRSRPWVRNTQILSFHVHCSLLMHSMKPDLLSSQRMQKSADGRKRSLLAWGFCTWPVCKPKLAS